MESGEWSRSRFWLCHFLHNRHERVPIEWGTPRGLPQPLNDTLLSWLARGGARSPINGAGLVRRTATGYPHDPAYVQSLRLLVKERQFHFDLIAKLRRHLGGGDRCPAWWEPIRVAALGLPGVRFGLSVLLLNNLIDLRLFELVHHAAADPALRTACEVLIRDKHAHAIFQAERLTMELANLHFVRRNIRRLRLRVMFGLTLAGAVASQSALIAAAGSTRSRFAAECWGDFHAMLERIVPYRREALLAALLAQRERPYDRPTAPRN